MRQPARSAPASFSPVCGLCIVWAAACLPLHGQARAATFVEIEGVVSMEAEHFTEKDGYVVRTDDGPDGLFKGFSGGAWVESNAEARRLDYVVTFRKTGKYYIHLRSWASHHKNNGFHALFDGKRVSGKGFYVKKQKRWSWYSHEHSSDNPETISFVVGTPGTHTFSITRREAEGYLDKIVLHDGRFGAGPAGKFEGKGPPETRASVGAAKALYERALKLEASGKRGPALEAYRKVVTLVGDWDFGKEAEARASALEKRRDEAVARAEKLIGEGKRRDAAAILDGLRREYGSTASGEVKHLKARLRARRAAGAVPPGRERNPEAAAREALEAARTAAGTDTARSYEALLRVAKSYPGTRAAAEARGIADRLWNDADTRREIEAARGAREAAGLLRSARNYILNGRHAQARDRLREIVDRFPDTTAAKEARKLLHEIRRR